MLRLRILSACDALSRRSGKEKGRPANRTALFFSMCRKRDITSQLPLQRQPFRQPWQQRHRPCQPFRRSCQPFRQPCQPFTSSSVGSCSSIGSNSVSTFYSSVSSFSGGFCGRIGSFGGCFFGARASSQAERSGENERYSNFLHLENPLAKLIENLTGTPQRVQQYLRFAPLAPSYFHGNQVFDGYATIAGIFGVNSTLMVENAAKLSQLTAYKDFFICAIDEQLLNIMRSLADPTRLRIVCLVLRLELSVGELVQILGQSQPRVSRHVRILEKAGILERRKEGSWYSCGPALF